MGRKEADEDPISPNDCAAPRMTAYVMGRACLFPMSAVFLVSGLPAPVGASPPRALEVPFLPMVGCDFPLPSLVPVCTMAWKV